MPQDVETTHNEEQVETTSEEATASGTEETSEESEEQQEEQEEQKKDGKLKRISTLAYRLREAERREREAKERALELEEQLLKKPQVDEDATPPPKPDDFDTEAEYLSALVAYSVKSELRSMKNEERQTEQQISQSREAVEAQKRQAENVERGYDTYGERFAEALYDVDYAPELQRAIGTSDMMPELAMFFLDNPGEVSKYESLPKRQMEDALLILAHEMKKARSSSKKKSEAPPPMKTVNSGSSTKSEIDFSKMSGDDYRKKKQAERAAARKRI